jgi:monoamine oxidase
VALLGYIRAWNCSAEPAQSAVGEYSSIRLKDWSIAVRCYHGATIEADAAILTVPLPLLSEIALPSAARERVAATADIGFGNVVKILFRFATKWWADHGGRDLADLSFLLSDATVPTWWTQHPAGYPVLTGWFAGPKADRVSSLTEAELIDMGPASLAEVFDLPLDRIRRDLVCDRSSCPISGERAGDWRSARGPASSIGVFPDRVSSR